MNKYIKEEIEWKNHFGNFFNDQLPSFQANSTPVFNMNRRLLILVVVFGLCTAAFARMFFHFLGLTHSFLVKCYACTGYGCTTGNTECNETLYSCQTGKVNGGYVSGCMSKGQVCFPAFFCIYTFFSVTLPVLVTAASASPTSATAFNIRKPSCSWLPPPPRSLAMCSTKN